MADKPFRVLLDLTELHIEHLKYVWMNVPPQELKTVSDFKRSVIRKVILDKVDINLFVRNGLLLDDETVMILREDDTVKVCYIDEYQAGYSLTEYHAKESKKSSRKRNHSGNVSDSLNSKKCKRDSKIFTREKEVLQSVEICNKKKKKLSSQCSENLYNQTKTSEGENYSTEFQDNSEKNTLGKNETDFNLLSKPDSFLSFHNQDSAEENEGNFKTNKNVDPNFSLKLNSAKDSLTANPRPKPENGSEKLFDINSKLIKSSEGLSNNCPKKKRKRREKRKHSLESVVNVTDSTEISKEFKSFTNEAERNISRKHIIYSFSPSKEKDIQLGNGSKNKDVVDYIQLHSDSKIKDVVDHIQLDSDSKNKYVVDHIKLGNDSKNKDVGDLMIDTFVLEGVSNRNIKPNNYPKISTPTRSDFCENPKWCSSLMQQTTINSHEKETKGFYKGKYKNCSHTQYSDEQCISFDISKSNEKLPESDYANLPPLNSRPDIGAHIAYKILELDEHYSPVISGYREGIVKSINLDNEEMEIELLKHEIKPARTGKFENLKKDEVPLPEIKRCDMVRWTALVEPKVIVSL